jgi:Xaa-Pro aminopeptidase
MEELGLDAYIIPTNDPHQSEYVADHWKSREWISGFTGSAGIIVVTRGHAGLWTDSRYFLQAEKELEGSTIVLHKVIVQHAPQHIQWLKKELPRGSKVGIDGWLCSMGQFNQYKKMLSSKDISLVISHDIIADIWVKRPRLPADKIYSHEIKYAGLPLSEKVDIIRQKMKDKDADLYLVTALDEIAWLFNIRGSDVDYNPVCIAYACVTMEDATLYIDPIKVPEEVFSRLQKGGVKIKGYLEIIGDLNKLEDDTSVLLDAHQTNCMVYQAVNGSIISEDSIIKHEKAIKNKTEINHIRQVMKKDGAALANAFFWLEQTLKTRTVNEAEFAERLAICRKDQGGYFGESFSAIVGYKGNGAIIHYRPHHETCADIRREGILLVDSGGQYVDGTTDITRTIALSPPTEEQKKNYTLVLKGHIALAQARFPEGTTGNQLDTFARQFLWEEGLNFSHGTGHGVGFFLNVHEGPQGFAPNASERGKTAHKAGMLTSNEPGYYKTGAYGIRIENLVLTIEDRCKEFLSYETVTLYPIDISLIEETAMSKKEKAWFNRYHARVYEEVSPLLDVEVKSWFKIKCRPLN